MLHQHRSTVPRLHGRHSPDPTRETIPFAKYPNKLGQYENERWDEKSCDTNTCHIQGRGVREGVRAITKTVLLARVGVSHLGNKMDLRRCHRIIRSAFNLQLKNTSFIGCFGWSKKERRPEQDGRLACWSKVDVVCLFVTFT